MSKIIFGIINKRGDPNKSFLGGWGVVGCWKKIQKLTCGEGRLFGTQE